MQTFRNKFAGIFRVSFAGEATDAGQASLEHLTRYSTDAGSDVNRTTWSTQSYAFATMGAELFGRFVKNATAFTPTLVIERAGSPAGNENFGARQVHFAAVANLTQQMRAKYKICLRRVCRTTRAQLQASLPLVSLMNRAGVQLLTGTIWLEPIARVQLAEEMALLSRRGVPVMC